MLLSVCLSVSQKKKKQQQIFRLEKQQWGRAGFLITTLHPSFPARLSQLKSNCSALALDVFKINNKSGFPHHICFGPPGVFGEK